MTDQIKTKVKQYLHEIPQNSKIYAAMSDGSKYFMFHHLDGMYSFCVTEKDNVYHLAAMTLLRKYKDGYRLVEAKT